MPSHQVTIYEPDYERLRRRYGGSWAGNARLLLARALDELDRAEAATLTFDQAPPELTGVIQPPPGGPQRMAGGPGAWGRHGWYVRVREPGNATIQQLIVYAERDTWEYAYQRAVQLLRYLDHDDWQPDMSDGKYTHRGGDIEVKKYPEGLA